jgi:hypothetical protein
LVDERRTGSGAEMGLVMTSGTAGVYDETVPLRAASIEKGRVLPEVFSGSMRRKGVEERRLLDSKLIRLCLGEPRL